MNIVVKEDGFCLALGHPDEIAKSEVMKPLQNWHHSVKM